MGLLAQPFFSTGIGNHLFLLLGETCARSPCRGTQQELYLLAEKPPPKALFLLTAFKWESSLLERTPHTTDAVLRRQGYGLSSRVMSSIKTICLSVSSPAVVGDFCPPGLSDVAACLVASATPCPVCFTFVAACCARSPKLLPVAFTCDAACCA